MGNKYSVCGGVLLLLVATNLIGVGWAATARGPARSYRGEARRRRAGIRAQIGGEEQMFAAQKHKVELANKVKKLAEKGAEFVFDSKEKVDAVFRCTACKRAVSALGKAIVGRLEIGRRRVAKGRPESRVGTRGKVRKRIRRLIEEVCRSPEITKDQNMAEQCPIFIQASGGRLEDMFLDHCDPDEESFEDDVNSEEVCRSVLLTDPDTCAPGVKSMDDLLADRINRGRTREAAERARCCSEKRKEARERQSERRIGR